MNKFTVFAPDRVCLKGIPILREFCVVKLFEAN